MNSVFPPLCPVVDSKETWSGPALGELPEWEREVGMDHPHQMTYLRTELLASGAVSLENIFVHARYFLSP